MSERRQPLLPANRSDIILELPGCTLRIPGYVPSITRRYWCPVEGGRYLLKWGKDGRLLSLVFYQQQKLQRAKKSTPVRQLTPTRELAPAWQPRPARVADRGRRNHTSCDEREKDLMDQIVEKTIAILNQARRQLHDS